MPGWLRNSLYSIALVCCGIIGARVYLLMNEPANTVDDGPTTGTLSSSQFPDKIGNFTLNDMWGKPRSISEWAGKPLILNFWATWCAPCRREMPLLEALHKQRGDIQVLGIAVDRQADVQTYMAEAGISYETLVGEEDAMKVSEQFGLSGLGLPFTAVISGEGDILTVFIGEIEAHELAVLADTAADVGAGRIDVATARAKLEQL
jgi:thiol-disulfide isomerase/thioredoxin